MDIDSIVTSSKLLADKLANIDTMMDEDIYKIIRNSYQLILSDHINDSEIMPLRKNSRFISVLSQVIMDIELTLEQRIYCNSMIYKELSESENVYLQRVYYILGLLVNQNMVNKIIEVGVDKGLATYLAVVRKSSFSAKDNVSRLNFSIICAEPECMTTQRITDIYCTIFNTTDEIKDLFLATVKDTFILTSNEDWITHDMITIATNMNYAILSILESLPITKLRGILFDYANMVMIEDISRDEVRIQLSHLDPNQFPNISIIRREIIEKDLYLP